MLLFGPVCCARHPSRASACRSPLAGAVPSWAVQLEWWGQDVGAAPVPAASSHRKVSAGFHICWRGDVSAASPVACGLLPLQLRQSRAALSCPPPVPPWEDERARGCSRGGDSLLLCSVWEQHPAAQKGHSSGRQNTDCAKNQREVRRYSRMVEAVLPWCEEYHHPFPLLFLCL